MLLNTFVLSALLSSINASPLYKRDENSQSKNSTNDNYLKFDLNSGPDFKAIEVSIGSNNQSLLLKLDSKSSNFWVNSDLNEYCLAYSELENFYSNSNSPKWIEVSNDIKNDYDNQIEKFEIENDSKLQNILSSAYKTASSQISQVTNNVIASDLENYIQSRNSEYNSLISNQISSATKKFDQFLKTASISSEISKVTSEVSSVASAIVSDSEQVATDVVNAWDSFTSNLVGVFEKRDESKSKSENGWEKFTSGAANFFKDLKKRDEMTMTVSGAVTTMNMNDMSSSSSLYSIPSNTALAYSASASASAPHSSAAAYSSVAYSSASYSAYTFASASASASASSTPDIAELVESLSFELTRNCSLYGVFNDSSSETFSTTDDYFVSEDGYTFGLIGNDTFTLLSNITFNSTFGIADVSNSNIGVVGIGKSNENSTFQSLPIILSENDYISKSLYSLYISSNDSSIIFGAIDYSRIDGNISVFPLLNDTDSISLTLSSINLTVLDESTNEITNSNETFAIIDTTSNNVLLPNETFNNLIDSLNNTFNVIYDDSLEYYTLSVIDEDYTTDDVFITFGFESESFDVSLSNFVIPLISNETFYYNQTTDYYNSANSSFYFDISDNGFDNVTYILSILPSSNDEVILGLDFLLDTIAVIVDLDSEEIGLAYQSGSESNSTYILTPSDDDFEF